MTTCPNGDPSFSRILLKTFGDDSPMFRRDLFYGVCIVIRFVIFGLMVMFYEKSWFPIVVALFSLISLLKLLSDLQSGNVNTWWSKRFQMIMVMILLGMSCFSIISHNNVSVNRFIPFVFLCSLLGGIYQSMFIKFC